MRCGILGVFPRFCSGTYGLISEVWIRESRDLPVNVKRFASSASARLGVGNRQERDGGGGVREGSGAGGRGGRVGRGENAILFVLSLNRGWLPAVSGAPCTSRHF